MTALTRRRMLTIFGATCSSLAVVKTPDAFAASLMNKSHTWNGTALGADATIAFHKNGPEPAEQAVQAVLREVKRLEHIFSLYHTGSELQRLNMDGYLLTPSMDMGILMRKALQWGEKTEGAFDITVQPIWQAYARYFGSVTKNETLASALAPAQDLVDYRRIKMDKGQIRLGIGQSITLNGIAQGYITDCIADMLQSRGWNNLLVSMGEVKTIGSHINGRPWRIETKTPNGLVLMQHGALATSSPQATIFDPVERHHHLLDPHLGISAPHARIVSVQAPRAVDADAASTGLGVMKQTAVELFLQHHKKLSAQFA